MYTLFTSELFQSGLENKNLAADTFVMDGHGGQYLLKKGEDVVISYALAHRYTTNAWGPEENALAFRPENFMPSPSEHAKGVDKARRAAWVPLRGGPGLCPGVPVPYMGIKRPASLASFVETIT
jgi:cytochrome P450